MAVRTPFNWNKASFSWDRGSAFLNQSKTPFTWDDVALIIQVAEVLEKLGPYADGDVQDDAIQDLVKDDPEKKKRLIKLICKVQGKIYKETKEIEEVKINIEDVKLLIKEALGINVTIL
jgi:hypothetical protein|tara:strand:+ start:294 stop:650 length:357 start_codon:yes stop_codon:yes gene_type:complete